VKTKRPISVKINARAWRKFEDPRSGDKDGDGYGIFFGVDVKKILTTQELVSA